MTFIEEIKKMQEDSNNQVNIVINEIVEYFKEYLETEDFKEYLKTIIMNSMNKGENVATLKINFWEYMAGGPQTYIQCGIKKFELNNQQYKYKNIRLKDIHKRICDSISNITQDKLQQLELKVVDIKRRDTQFKFGYYNAEINFSWQ